MEERANKIKEMLDQLEETEDSAIIIASKDGESICMSINLDTANIITLLELAKLKKLQAISSAE